MVQVCGDQRITAEELVKIQLGIERVIPQDARAEIRRKRRALIPPPMPKEATQRQIEYIRILRGEPPPGLSK